MDRGIPTEGALGHMRPRQIDYLVGTPEGKLNAVEQKPLGLPWTAVHDGMEVKLSQDEGELWVLTKSSGRQAKETTIHRARVGTTIDPG